MDFDMNFVKVQKLNENEMESRYYFMLFIHFADLERVTYFEL